MNQEYFYMGKNLNEVLILRDPQDTEVIPDLQAEGWEVFK